MALQIHNKEIAGGCAAAALVCFGASASSRLAKGLRVTSAGIGALLTIGAVYEVYSYRVKSKPESKEPPKPESKVKIDLLAFLRDAGYDLDELDDVGELTDLSAISFGDQTVVRGMKDEELFIAVDLVQEGIAIFYPYREGDDIGFVGDQQMFTRKNFDGLLKNEFVDATPKKKN